MFSGKNGIEIIQKSMNKRASTPALQRGLQKRKLFRLYGFLQENRFQESPWVPELPWFQYLWE